jgi:hypothetical protein
MPSFPIRLFRWDFYLFGCPLGICEIGLFRGNSENIVRVKDTGPGISEHERDAVLRRFHRSDQTRHTSGLGLGLNLVAAIVRLHGFRFTIVPGSGCTAEIACPHAPTLTQSAKINSLVAELPAAFPGLSSQLPLTSKGLSSIGREKLRRPGISNIGACGGRSHPQTGRVVHTSTADLILGIATCAKTQHEQMFSALPPIADILDGGRIASWKRGGRFPFHSRHYANMLVGRASPMRLALSTGW